MRALRIALALFTATAVTTAEAQRGRRDEAPKPQQEASPPMTAQKIFPTKVSWVALSLNGKPFSGERPTFTLDEQFRMRGFGGCNTFAATSFPLREQRFAVGPFALTKKSCDKAAMASERSFLVALRTAQQWDTADGRLILKGQNGELRFDRSL